MYNQKLKIILNIVEKVRYKVNIVEFIWIIDKLKNKITFYFELFTF
jgi:hypothetical protein